MSFRAILYFLFGLKGWTRNQRQCLHSHSDNWWFYPPRTRSSGKPVEKTLSQLLACQRSCNGCANEKCCTRAWKTKGHWGGEGITLLFQLSSATLWSPVTSWDHCAFFCWIDLLMSERLEVAWDSNRTCLLWLNLNRVKYWLFAVFFQMQLFSVSNQNSRIKSKRSRLRLVKNFVCGVNTLLQKARDLATNMRRACEHMDFENLVSLPDEISTASSSVVRQMRAFIQIQYSSYVDNNLNIVDELEYLEKKCNDIELAAGGLRKTLQRFVFLSPPKSLRKKHTCKVLNAGEYSSPLSERPENVTSPVCMRGRKHETGSARRLWSKESPVWRQIWWTSMNPSQSFGLISFL